MTRTPHLTRRAAVGLAVLLGTSACGLRLEDDSPLPGPTASAAPDTRPLTAVRAHLVETMAAAARETTYAREAAGVQPLHRQQLQRLDATLKGLDAKNLPRATATGDPSSPAGGSRPSSTAAGPTSASVSPSTSATGDAPASSSSALTGWAKAEAGWIDPTMCATLAAVSTYSRPLALAIAARGVAALPHDAAPTWSADAALQSGTTLLSPLERSIDALEWLAATTAADDRGDLPAVLRRLYAARSLVEAGDLSAAGRARSTAQRYTSSSDARSVAASAAQSLTSACASAASHTPSGRHVSGLLQVWATAIATEQFLGSKPGAFPGLAA